MGTYTIVLPLRLQVYLWIKLRPEERQLLSDLICFCRIVDFRFLFTADGSHHSAVFVCLSVCLCVYLSVCVPVCLTVALRSGCFFLLLRCLWKRREVILEQTVNQARPDLCFTPPPRNEKCHSPWCATPTDVHPHGKCHPPARCGVWWWLRQRSTLAFGAKSLVWVFFWCWHSAQRIFQPYAEFCPLHFCSFLDVSSPVYVCQLYLRLLAQPTPSYQAF